MTINAAHDDNDSVNGLLKDPSIVQNLFITLEELLQGTSKKVIVTRKVQVQDGSGTKEEDKVFIVDVKPEWKDGTKITFHGEGHQCSSGPGDVVFIIRDKPHPLFVRDGANIRYTVNVKLRHVFFGVWMKVPTLCGGKLLLHKSQIHNPSTRFPGQGLPTVNGTRGDLIVDYELSCRF